MVICNMVDMCKIVYVLFICFFVLVCVFLVDVNVCDLNIFFWVIRIIVVEEFRDNEKFVVWFYWVFGVVDDLDYFNFIDEFFICF